ncbi:probable cyclin-dependent serine/threonine-protein kinase DDB_G0292550 [Microplitis mediator]|uniref:probable cyclin-dependent serine/threonine-protein kinase DDB_G0292550 n=1 Tax=Microplitis mediator TaxID=375433 RepID=UPI002555B25B|nr:probable cyclin-dependent serine/threonine-protein kinase DDB_G0292550 [Microplitis mediator]
MHCVNNYMHHKNPVRSKHMSRNNGDVISIMIPEDPDSNLNIDQLTLDFRRQLELIKQQRRINKFENHYLINTKNDISSVSKSKNSFKNNRKKLNNWKIIKNETVNHRRFGKNFGKSKKQIKYRSNIEKRLQSKNQYNFSKNKKNQWKDVNDVKCNKIKSLCKNKFSNNFHKESKSSFDVINSEKGKVINENRFAINNNRKEKLQRTTESSIRKSKVNDYIIPNTKNVGFDTLPKDNSIPDCSQQIDKNGQEYLLCFNGSAINLPEKTVKTVENINYFNNNKEESVNNDNSSVDNINSNRKVYPINIQVNDYKEIEKILQNPEVAMKHINPVDFEKNKKVNLNDINNKKSRDTQSNHNSENNLIIKPYHDDRQVKISNDYSESLLSNYELNDKSRYDSLNNEEQSSRDLSQSNYQSKSQDIYKISPQLYFDSENLPIRIKRSTINNSLSKPYKTHVQQPGEKLNKHKLAVKKKLEFLKKKLMKKKSFQGLKKNYDSKNRKMIEKNK